MGPKNEKKLTMADLRPNKCMPFPRLCRRMQFNSMQSLPVCAPFTRNLIIIKTAVALMCVSTLSMNSEDAKAKQRTI